MEDIELLFMMFPKILIFLLQYRKIIQNLENTVNIKPMEISITLLENKNRVTTFGEFIRSYQLLKLIIIKSVRKLSVLSWLPLCPFKDGLECQQ